MNYIHILSGIIASVFIKKAEHCNRLQYPKIPVLTELPSAPVRKLTITGLRTKVP